MNLLSGRRLLAVSAAAVLAGCGALLFVLSSDKGQDPSMKVLGDVVTQLKQDPQGTAADLPPRVSTYYEPAAAGASQLRGYLYVPARDGRCAVADVTVDRSWFTTEADGTFTVTAPSLRERCPGQ